MKATDTLSKGDDGYVHRNRKRVQSTPLLLFIRSGIRNCAVEFGKPCRFSGDKVNYAGNSGIL